MKNLKNFFPFFLALFILVIQKLPADEMRLRDQLPKAREGDFIVASQNKTNTVLIIKSKSENSLAIEEISIPIEKMTKQNLTWANWVKQGAPGHTSWMLYQISLPDGILKDSFNLSKNGWIKVSQPENFLSTLLNLRLTSIGKIQRKKIGPSSGLGPDQRRFWQPKMVVDGKVIEGVPFTAWRTYWPEDNSPLSGKTIDIYVPEENDKYPSYFPYWLQISGMIGKARVHIIDSGSNLSSPAPILK